MPLHIDYRPISLEEVYGNEATIESLKVIMERDEDDWPSSFLFTGPSGCGKTTLGKIVANMITDEEMSIQLYNASNTRGIDTVRFIVDDLSYAPVIGNKKVYILEECHQITGAAQEALLQVLEEPPSHCHFILCTTDPDKLKPTFKRRCHRFELNPLFPKEIKQLIVDVCKEENVEVDKEVVDKIVSVCDGSPGKALIILDSVIDIEDKKKAIEAIESTTLSESQVRDICQLLMSQDAFKPKWKKLAIAIRGLKGEPEQIRYAISGYFEAVLLGKGDDKTAGILSNFLDSFMYTGRAGLTFSIYNAAKDN